MKEAFPIVPATGGPIWVFVGLGVLLLAMVGLFGYIVWSSRHVTFEVSSAGLRVCGDLYGRRISLESLVVDNARIIDLESDADHRPKWKTNGTGLPGYSAGWFRLRNGEKALVFMTDRRRVLYLPTRQGHCLLLSPAAPDALLRALRAAAAS